jgi:hypothetical protein
MGSKNRGREIERAVGRQERAGQEGKAGKRAPAKTRGTRGRGLPQRRRGRNWLDQRKQEGGSQQAAIGNGRDPLRRFWTYAMMREGKSNIWSGGLRKGQRAAERRVCQGHGAALTSRRMLKQAVQEMALPEGVRRVQT